MNIITEILPAGKLDPETWDRFIRQSPQGALYALYGYASIIAPEWQAIIVRNGESWLGVMPLAPKRKWGIPYVPHPVFSQYWGIFFAPFPTDSAFAQYRRKKAVVEAIVETLAPYQRFTQNFAPEFDYPLPFSWKGYRLESRYTYVLPLQASENTLWEDLAPALRRQIRKAEKNGLSWEPLETAEPFFSLIEQNLDAGNAVMGNINHWRDLLNKLWNYVRLQGIGTLRQVRNQKGEVLAAGLFVRFEHKTLYLTGAYDPGQRASGAMDLLMWKAILQAHGEGCHEFDFEGSMIEGVERFFRKFGASPIPYLQIVKNDLLLLPQWIQELR